MIGYDQEWPPFAKIQRVTVMQMCVNISPNKYECFLFQLNQIGERSVFLYCSFPGTGVPQCIIDLINDDRMVLTGVELLQFVHLSILLMHIHSATS